MNKINWLTPLGFVGLLGLIILLIIYLLKPNYQQKFVSSSYVWKLSLKYKKRSIPTSRLRNILIVICQVLIISISAFILAQPFLVVAQEQQSVEKIVIIDASASMRAHDNQGNIRFDRAVSKIRALRQAHQGSITVIVADKDPYIMRYGEDYVAFRSDFQSAGLFNKALDNLSCTYGDADIDRAMRMAEEVLYDAPLADVIYYTGTQCADYGDKVTIELVSDTDEYNAAILNCSAVFEEGYYTFAVEVACYVQDRGDLPVYIQVDGANADDETEGVTISPQPEAVDSDPCVVIARCVNNVSDVVYFRDLKVTSFESVRVYISEDDSFTFDNEFVIYGGTKETINVLYSSALPNTFFSTVFASLSQVLKSRWTIITEQDSPAANSSPEYSGYDFYIFEHGVMPKELPKDGVVLIVDNDSLPQDLGITLGSMISTESNEGFSFSEGQSAEDLHPIMNGVRPDNIHVWQYMQVVGYEGFQPVMFCGSEDPVVLIKNERDSKVVFFAFDLNYSDLSMVPDFAILMYNIYNYFMPFTFTSASSSSSVAPTYIFDADAKVNLNARGPVLSILCPDGTTQTYDGFPAEMGVSVPGTYFLTQTLLPRNDRTREITERFYVKVSAVQSNFSRSQVIKAPFFPPAASTNWDLLIYLAAAVVALLFAERLLQSRDQS